MELAMNASSIPALVVQRAASHGTRTILRRKDRGIWKAMDWSHLLAQVSEIGQALLGFELGRGDAAAIISETRPEAAYADLAIQGCGAVSVMIHPEDEAERIQQILHASGSRLVFVESEEQLDKVLTIRDRCPSLSRIVIFDMKGLREFSDRHCISLSSFLAGSRFAPNWAETASAVTPDQAAIMVFPRGGSALDDRVLSHRDVLHMVAGARSRLSFRPHDERLAVLRMSDIAERVWGLYVALDAGCVSNYLESPDTAVENLQELQPTVLGADAEAWAHLHARATASATAATTAQRMLYDWGLRAGRSGGIATVLANLVVLRAVRQALGLKRLRLAYVGGGPVSSSTQDWAKCLGITIQRIDEPRLSGDQRDAEYQALMQGAHA
jgi:long-chain acyl-CoA synthetase